MRKNFFKLAIRKTYYYYYILLKIHLNQKETTYNKRLATKTVADWELEVVVYRTEPIRMALDWRE